MFIKLKEFLGYYDVETIIQIETYADSDECRYDVEYNGTINELTYEELLNLTVDYVEVVDGTTRIVVYC